MNRLIVVFNGPPNSGKDHAARAMSVIYEAPHFEMKAPLRKIAHDYFAAFFNCDYLQAEKMCNEVESSKALKDTYKFTSFGGRTWRQMLIHISEDVVKPLFGKDAFGRAAAQSVHNSDSQLCFFSDGGFQSEIEELRKVGTVLVIQIERQGCSWALDSRGYINGDYTVNVFNDGTEDFINKVHAQVHKYKYEVLGAGDAD